MGHAQCYLTCALECHVISCDCLPELCFIEASDNLGDFPVLTGDFYTYSDR